MAESLNISKSGYDKKEVEENNFESNTIIQLSEILDVGEDYFWLNLSPHLYDQFEECKPVIFQFIRLERDKRDWLLKLLRGAEIVEKINQADPVGEDFVNGLLSDQRRLKLKSRRVSF